VTQCVFDAFYSGDLDTAADAAEVLFHAGCSGSGTFVRSFINEAQRTPSTVAVLILGFAGSSVELLEPLVGMYRSEFPEWRVVATVASGLCNDPQAAVAADTQINNIARSLVGARKILVHIMSNNGQGLWASLLHLKGSLLRSRVGAVIYDCAASRSVASVTVEGAAHVGHVILSTVKLPIMQMQIEVDVPARAANGLALSTGEAFSGEAVSSEAVSCEAVNGEVVRTETLSLRNKEAFNGPLQAAVDRLVQRPPEQQVVFWSQQPPRWGEWPAVGPPEAANERNSFSFDAYSTPPVPTLCFTSQEDTIITPAAVEDWACYLKEAHPARDVRVVTLRGTHCMLRRHSATEYLLRVRTLVADARLADEAAPIVLGISAAAAAVAVEAAASPFGELLTATGLQQLTAVDDLMRTLSLDDACALYIAQGRGALISKAKELGVGSLGDRQKLATAVGKYAKQRECATGVPVS